MKILFAGRFDRSYNRTQILLDGLKKVPGVEVSFYNYKEERFSFIRLKRAIAAADVVFMPSFTHMNVPLIRLLSNKPIIFDPFISRYLTKVFDYKLVKKKSIRGYKNYLKDKISMQLADLVVYDTAAHRDYFHETFGIPLEKMKSLPIGVNTDDFYPVPAPEKQHDKFVAGFYGAFIPLQGVTQIVEAAKLLVHEKNVEFRIIGAGFEFDKIKKIVADNKLSNVTLTGWMKHEELAGEISQFDICLGIFGETHKADLVIPNKIFHYAAVGKPIVSKDSPAIREMFRNNESMMLTSIAPEDIAAAILRLRDDRELREKIAQNGHHIVAGSYNHVSLAQSLVDMAASLLQHPKFATT